MIGQSHVVAFQLLTGGGSDGGMLAEASRRLALHCAALQIILIPGNELSPGLQGHQSGEVPNVVHIKPARRR